MLVSMHRPCSFLLLLLPALAAVPTCLLDGTLWRGAIGELNASISIKTGLGPAASVLEGRYWAQPRTSMECAPSGCLVAPSHGCDPAIKDRCVWLGSASMARPLCDQWPACAGFVCNSTAGSCEARQGLIREYQRSLPRYDAITGSVLLSEEAGPEMELYLKIESAEYTIEASPNCGAQLCPFRWAAGTVEAGQISLTRETMGEVMEGALSTDCESIQWQDGSRWRQLNLEVKTVHVVYMAHLDLGYTVVTVDDLIDKYLFDFFPESLETSRRLREKKSSGQPVKSAQFQWTSHPWLISAILNNQTGKTTQQNITDLGEAIARGDITWHANPLNPQSEIAEPSHLASGFEIARRLGAEFNLSTELVGEIMGGASQKDEPGLTLGMVGMMASAGIKMLHVGVNDFSTVPAAPTSSAHYHGYCNPFEWRDGNHSLMVTLCSGYSEAFQVQAEFPTMSTLLPGMDQALVFLMRVDNSGPQSAEQVEEGWAAVQQRYPNAELKLSSIGRFGAAVLEVRDSLPADALPALEAGEWGSSWIFGVPSTPAKIRLYRAAARVRAAALAAGTLDLEDPRVRRFDNILLKVPEHTAGFNGGGCNGRPWDDRAWGNASTSCSVGSTPYQQNLDSYRDQQSFVARAVAELSDYQPFRTQVEHAMNQSEPELPLQVLAGANIKIPLQNLTDPGLKFRNGVSARFDSAGGMTELCWEHECTTAVTKDNLLGVFSYATHSEASLNQFRDAYNLRSCRAVCGGCGFSKCGLDQDGAVSTRSSPTVQGAWQDSNSDRLVMNLSFPNLVGQDNSSPPGYMLLSLKVSTDEDAHLNPNSHVPDEDARVVNISWDLSVYEKRATRMAESMWFSFNPQYHDTGNHTLRSSWEMNKLGKWINPLSARVNGSATLHSVWDGIHHLDRDGVVEFALETLDAPVVSPGWFAPTGAFGKAARPDLGWNFCLFNNAWSTNYALWSIEPTQRYRFNASLRMI
eukprot:TRINITY_DN424_c0_g7_i1.p1 TRINITY_DN424_c0_g7~~TRINITY_DN424_c0_g7_i1.p1  ORF type:complete len:974 (+),score=146.08 TRINITY_DN424_c0_g7_i1:115-3036(+)